MKNKNSNKAIVAFAALTRMLRLRLRTAHGGRSASELRMLENFIEHPDRYEKGFKVGSNDIVVCINKDDISDESKTILKFVLNDLVKIIEDSLTFINDRKTEYEIDYINDFSDPQIIVGEDNFSVYWCSEEGEEKAAAIIAADYYWPERKWQGLTIGD